MQDTAQQTRPYSATDLMAFGLAALLPLFFIFMRWYEGYPAISYLVDIAAPENFQFNPAILWLLPLAVVGSLTFSFWGVVDVYATRFTSRAIAAFAGLGLLYFLWALLALGFNHVGDFNDITLIPINTFDKITTIQGGSAFVPMLIIFIILAAQVLIPRELPEAPTGYQAPRMMGMPPAIFFPLFFVANFVLVLILANWGGILRLGGDLLGYTFNQERVADVVMCSDSTGCSFWHPVIFSAIVLVLTITGFAYTTLLERKLIAYFQQRVGPNRVGPGGFLQPAADGLKLIFKENILPSSVDKGVYRIAPLLKASPTLIMLAVIPFGPDIVVPWFDGNWYQVPLALSNPGVGVLFLLAVTSIGTYGVVLAGWSSNNKYSMLGGMRAASQMVSYELPLGLSMMVPVLIAGSLSVTTIVQEQGGFFLNWFVFQNPLAALILTLALIAEVGRSPFDLPEAEQELTAGYITEYSGLKFALFMMAEYLGMIGVSAIAISMFFGGYHDGLGLVDSVPILGPLVMIGKIIFLLIGFIWIRATLPRLRYDRLMAFGWKVMLPLALLSIVWTAFAVIVGEEFGGTAYVLVSVVMAALVLLGSLFFLGRPDEETGMDDVETDSTITGSQDGIVWGVLNLVGGIIAIPMVLVKVSAPVMNGLWEIITVPFMALFNIGEGRRRFREGVLAVVEPIAALGPGDDANKDDTPKLGSGEGK